MGEDLHSVLVNLEEEPKVWHGGAALHRLLVVQGGALALRIAAPPIVAWASSTKDIRHSHYAPNEGGGRNI